ncbi:MAG TPA: hypothetical protein VF476_06835 [Chitinophagaceae bacterium]
MKKLLKWTFFILGILTLVAAISLLWHDYKERSWYNESVNSSQKKDPDTMTVVCILATVHHSNPNYNADSIVAILNQFQPNLILTEEDTALFENYHKSYDRTLQRPLFARLGRSFGFGNPEEIEGISVRKYKISHPAVDIRPFDYEGRNAFYVTNNSFFKEAEVSNRLEHLANNRSLTKEQAVIWSVYLNINDTLNRLTNQTPHDINQQVFYELTERRQYYQYHKVAEIVNSNDSLKEYSEFYKTNADFWDTRNKRMSEHIANFIRQYPNKRIIVLTGAMHKYYLLKELRPLQNQLNFRLREYYE